LEIHLGPSTTCQTTRLSKKLGYHKNYKAIPCGNCHQKGEVMSKMMKSINPIIDHETLMEGLELLKKKYEKKIMFNVL